MVKRCETILELIIGIVLLGGCALLPDNTLQSTNSEDMQTPEVTLSIPQATKIQSIEGAAVIFRQSGGLAGMDLEWTVYADGRVVNKEGQIWRAAPEQVNQLLRDIDELGFFDVKQNEMPRDTCCDRFLYELSVTMEDKNQSLTTIDGDENAPQALWDAIRTVREFLDQFTSNTQL